MPVSSAGMIPALCIEAHSAIVSIPVCIAVPIVVWIGVSIAVPVVEGIEQSKAVRISVGVLYVIGPLCTAVYP